MAHQYFVESSQVENLKKDKRVALLGAEARHASKVSRLRVGETIRVSDGHGKWALGTVSSSSSERVDIDIFEAGSDTAKSFRITLVQALAKGGRDELAVELATEFGVDKVLPWQAERSIVKWDALKAQKNQQKWQKIVAEASKQCLRASVPQVLPFVKGSDIVSWASSKRNVFVLHPRGSVTLRSALQKLVTESSKETQDISFIVGPEGGLSDSEIKSLEEAGAETVSLGSEVLRASSAGSAAIAVANVVFAAW